MKFDFGVSAMIINLNEKTSPVWCNHCKKTDLPTAAGNYELRSTYSKTPHSRTHHDKNLEAVFLKLCTLQIRTCFNLIKDCPQLACKLNILDTLIKLLID